MEKSIELNSPDSCLNKAAEDEPIFVLRATDMLAPIVIRSWIKMAHVQGCEQPKLIEAERCAAAMDEWAKVNGSKFPD